MREVLKGMKKKKKKKLRYKKRKKAREKQGWNKAALMTLWWVHIFALI